MKRLEIIAWIKKAIREGGCSDDISYEAGYKDAAWDFAADFGLMDEMKEFFDAPTQKARRRAKTMDKNRRKIHLVLAVPPEYEDINDELVFADFEAAISGDWAGCIYMVESAERELQRRSFAYGNTHIANELVTKDMVNEQADKLEGDNGEEA